MFVPDANIPGKVLARASLVHNIGAHSIRGRNLPPGKLLEEQVIEEDIGVMTGVQAGVESSAVDDGGVLTPAWEACIAGFYRHMVRQLQALTRARKPPWSNPRTQRE